MAAPVGSLNALLGVDTVQFNAGFARAEATVGRFEKSLLARSRNLQRFGKRLSGIGSTLTTKLSLPLAIAGVASGKMAADFDASMTKIETLVGIAGEEVEGMKKEVLALAGDTARAPEELAEALFTITSAGLRGSAAMETLQLAAKASASGLGETKDIARAVTGILQSYGQENINAARATDILTAIVREGNLEASELAPVLGRITGIASQLGISFEEVGASIATFTRLGVDSAEAVTGLRGVMNSLIKPTEGGRKALASVGLTFEDLRKQVKEKGLTKTLLGLVKSFEGNTEGLSQLIPNVRALSTVLGTAGAQGEQYEQILDSISNSQGILNEAFEKTTEESAFKFEQVLAKLKVAAIKVGNVILPFFTSLAEKVTEAIDKFTSLDESTQKAIAAVAGIAIAIGPVLSAVGALSTSFGTLIKFLPALISPIGLVIAGVLALGAGLLIAQKHINRVQSAQSVLNDTMKDAQKAVSGEFAEIQKLLTIAKSEVLSREKRQAAIDELQKKYPDYLKNLNLESINSETAAKSIDMLKESILKVSMVRAIEAKIQDIQAKKIDAVTSSGQSELTMWDQLVIGIAGFVGPAGKVFAVSERVTRGLERGKESGEAYDAQIDKLVNSLANLEDKQEAVTDATEDGNEALDNAGKSTEDAAAAAKLSAAQWEAQRISILKARKEFDKFAQALLKGTEIKVDTDFFNVKPIISDLEEAQQAARAFSFAFDEKPVQVLQRQQDVLRSFIEEAVKLSGVVTPATQLMIDKFEELGGKIKQAEFDTVSFGQRVMTVVQEATQVAGELFSGFFATNAQLIKNEEIALDNRFRKERELIEESGASEARKIKAIEALEKKTEAERRKLIIKRAKADKASAILSAIVNTAVAVTKALTAGPIFGPILAATIGALGVAQISTIASQPIPALAAGALAFGATLAVVGDNPNARRDPEVIQPLSSLKGLLDKGGGMAERLVARIAGTDIELVLERTKANREMIR